MFTYLTFFKNVPGWAGLVLLETENLQLIRGRNSRETKCWRYHNDKSQATAVNIRSDEQKCHEVKLNPIM